MKIWIINLLCHMVSGLSICLPNSAIAAGQNAMIGISVSEGLSLRAEGPSELNFNQLQSVISTGTTVRMGLTDPSTAVYSLQGIPGKEVSVIIETPADFNLDGLHPVPFEARLAWAKGVSGQIISSRNMAMELPAGQSMLNIKLPASSDRSTEGYSGDTRSKIYLFIYGTLGPVPHNAPTGIYSGSIRIHANYTNN